MTRWACAITKTFNVWFAKPPFGAVFFCLIFRYNIHMKLEKIIVVLGPPGSGKGTQSKLLVEKLGYAFFGMGDALRAAAKEDSELGRRVKGMIDQGLIVTDDLAEEVARASWE